VTREIGLPAPIPNLLRVRGNDIVVGAGPNGWRALLLARAGSESGCWAREPEPVGGACTIEEPFPAYVCRLADIPAPGLLHPLVVGELGLADRGFIGPRFEWVLCAFSMGRVFNCGEDDDACERRSGDWPPRDVKGWKARAAVIRRPREELGLPGKGDAGIGDAPYRKELDAAWGMRGSAPGDSYIGFDGGVCGRYAMTHGCKWLSGQGQ